MVDLLPTQLRTMNKVLDINLPPINQELEPIKVAHQEHQEHPEQLDMEHLEQLDMEQPLTHHQV